MENTEIIQCLSEQPGFLETLAGWHHAQWGFLNPGKTLEERLAEMQRHLEGRPIPRTFTAVDGTLLGSASIIQHDMDTRMQWTPWLASVYVAPEHREQGVGGRLVRHVMEYANRIGVARLYLFTPDREAFYLKLGWSVLEKASYRGVDITVMTAGLGRSPGV